MHTNWRAEIPQLSLLTGMFVAAAATWPFAPERIPVHWNINGDVDRYGGRLEGLLAVPLIAAVLYALLLMLPRIDPGRANYESFRAAYRGIRLSILSLVTMLYACIQLTAFGHDVNMRAVVPIALGLLFIVLGNFMGKLRPNWFVGVRTPWTLSSRRSWNKTHRLAGWLFIGMGLAVAAYGFVQTLWMLVVAATVSVVSLSWMVIYSYLVWRDDPERLSPAGTSPSSDGEESDRGEPHDISGVNPS